LRASKCNEISSEIHVVIIDILGPYGRPVMRVAPPIVRIGMSNPLGVGMGLGLGISGIAGLIDLIDEIQGMQGTIDERRTVKQAYDEEINRLKEQQERAVKAAGSGRQSYKNTGPVSGCAPSPSTTKKDTSIDTAYGMTKLGNEYTVPALKFNEDRTSYSYELDIQGMEPEDIKLSLQDNILIVEGTKMVETEGGYYSQSFKRSFTLPREANLDTLRSRDLGTGKLTVTADKLVPEPEPTSATIREITIERLPSKNAEKQEEGAMGLEEKKAKADASVSNADVTTAPADVATAPAEVEDKLDEAEPEAEPANENTEAGIQAMKPQSLGEEEQVAANNVNQRDDGTPGSDGVGTQEGINILKGLSQAGGDEGNVQNDEADERKPDRT